MITRRFKWSCGGKLEADRTVYTGYAESCSVWTAKTKKNMKVDDEYTNGRLSVIKEMKDYFTKEIEKLQSLPNKNSENSIDNIVHRSSIGGQIRLSKRVLQKLEDKYANTLYKHATS